MSIVKHRPFYWVDIFKTEKYLSDLSADGLFLCGMNFFSGDLYFKKGEPCRKSYVIRRSTKCGGAVPRKMREDGWRSVCGNRNNYAAEHDGEVSITPSCRSYRKMISVLKFMCFYIALFFSGFISGFMAGFTEDGIPAKGDDDHIAFWIILSVTALITAAVLICCVIAYIRLRKCGKVYDNILKVETDIDFTIPKENFIYTKAEEKQLRREKKLVSKFRIGWYLSPDMTEKYVEEMERKGWNFYRFGKFGIIFFFIKGSPRNVRFAVDYQNDISDEYLLSNMEAGWKLQFKSVTKVGGYIVWLKEYEGEPPQFYSEGESMLRHARTVMITYLCIYIPCLFIYGDMLLSFDFGSENFWDGFFLGAVLALLIEITVMIILTVGFYLRTRKKCKGDF